MGEREEEEEGRRGGGEERRGGGEGWKVDMSILGHHTAQ